MGLTPLYQTLKVLDPGRRQRPAAGVDWYNPGGSYTIADAWDFKNAASYAAAIVGLVNGTTMTTTSAPSWSSGVGLTFDGVSNFLDTQFITDETYSVAIQFNNGSGNGVIFGRYTTGGNFFYIQTNQSGNRRYFLNNDTVIVFGGVVTSGNIIMTGNAGYYNGSSDGSMSPSSPTPTRNAFLGDLNGTGGNKWAGDVSSLAIYSTILDASQAATLAAAMAAL